MNFYKFLIYGTKIRPFFLPDPQKMSQADLAKSLDTTAIFRQYVRSVSLV